jgi:hypothetical protein
VSKAPRKAILATFILASKCRGQTDEALATVHVQGTTFLPISGTHVLALINNFHNITNKRTNVKIMFFTHN